MGSTRPPRRPSTSTAVTSSSRAASSSLRVGGGGGRQQNRAQRADGGGDPPCAPRKRAHVASAPARRPAEERACCLATVRTVLDAVKHAVTGRLQAVDTQPCPGQPIHVPNLHRRNPSPLSSPPLAHHTTHPRDLSRTHAHTGDEEGAGPGRSVVRRRRRRGRPCRRAGGNWSAPRRNAGGTAAARPPDLRPGLSPVHDGQPLSRDKEVEALGSSSSSVAAPHPHHHSDVYGLRRPERSRFLVSRPPHILRRRPDSPQVSVELQVSLYDPLHESRRLRSERRRRRRARLDCSLRSARLIPQAEKRNPPPPRRPAGIDRSPAMSSSRFSPALQASDLNDFIAPSQDCVISLNKSSAASRLPIKKKEIVVSTKPPEESVKISLKDCLACSGCITSAETVMLEKQSLDDFITRIKSGKAVIVSVSPQSRASLAAFFGISQSQVFRKLTALFKSMGVKAVYDTSSSRDLALIEACNEFVSRYQLNELCGGKEAGTSLPMLSSACPGWICYAEKTLGSYILPYISSVKSPQQVIGAAIKHHMVEKLGLKPYDVYHVTVMPCYDKKLEAVRDDFVFSVEDKEITEVDSVLTTGEVLDLIQSKSIEFKTMEESPLDRLLTNVDEDGHLYGVSGGSGGYAETIFRYAARVLFNKEIEGSIDFKTLRNSDFREVTLEVEGRPVLKFALCYGFRNLQNIVRKIKMRKCEYQFIEVMACPSGCLNGGGQIKPVKGQSPKDLIQKLEGVYMQDVSISSPFDNPIAKRLYDDWLVQPGSENAKRYLHTQYHPVVRSVTSQLQNW